MKNLTAIFFFLLFSFSLFAQYDRPGILISTSLGFSKKQDLSQTFFFPTNVPKPEFIFKSFSIAPEASYVFNEKFMIGLGYFSNSNENISKQFVNAFLNGVNTVTPLTNSFKSNLYGPTIHMRYSQNIISRLLFSLKFTYFNLKGEDSSERTNPFNNPNTVITEKSSSTYNFGEVRFSPSLHYFISQKFGCYIETVGLNLRVSDTRIVDKDIDYNFDLTPNTWRVGLYYFIPTQKAVE